MTLKNYKLKLIALAVLATGCTVNYTLAAQSIVNQIMPGYNNHGTWIYDGTYDASGDKGPVKAGMFFSDLDTYNQAAAAAGHPDSQFNQVFSYGGDLEMYCDGGEGGQDPNACTYNTLLLVYYPPSVLSKKYDSYTVGQIISQFGDSGFSTVNQYAGLDLASGSSMQKVQTIVDIDGRVDMSPAEDYLNELNSMPQADAEQFADKVAAQICADDHISGVQFDIEPFSFLGTGGTVKGPGQEYFYQEISKDFAGNYSGNNWPNPEAANDPLHCVDQAHPYGRIFSVFTFHQALEESPQVEQEIQQVFGSGSGSYGNGYIVDSLYDLSSAPGGTYTPPATYSNEVQQEVVLFSQEADKLGVPYQFAIPAAASAHEFESVGGVATGADQDQYVQAALQAIYTGSVLNDPLFKGTNIWGWNSAMWWGGKQFTPANPVMDQKHEVETDLENHLDGTPYSRVDS